MGGQWRRTGKLIILGMILGLTVEAKPLQKFEKVQSLDHSANDGDSFKVELNGDPFQLRLYYIDCPEVKGEMDGDLRRIREQARYWGLSEPKTVIKFGDRAAEFVKKRLKDPFTVHTAFAQAPGRSAKGRIYGFVKTADGKDLGTLLVREGLARARGLGRKNPEGVSRREIVARLQDLELTAAIRRVGIWAATEPELIPGFRREEREDVDDLRQALYPAATPERLLDPNQAEEKELRKIPGIGPVFARRIIENRPYINAEDLSRVQGIGKKRQELLLEYLQPVDDWQKDE